MAVGEQDWKPGSFTKNFSWGPPANGLLELDVTPLSCELRN